jgi:hypothetical protein
MLVLLVELRTSTNTKYKNEYILNCNSNTSFNQKCLEKMSFLNT